MEEAEEFHGETQTVGQRLKAAREQLGMSLDDLATTTRIPTRHLESLENSDFDRLPAPTYSMGFAKNYAAAVGLDRREIADDLRAEMGGSRPAVYETNVYEPTDPARTFPKWLILVVLAAIVLVLVGLNYLRSRELSPDEETPAATSVQPEQAPLQVPAPTVPAASGPVVLTATQPVWLQVYEKGGDNLFQGELKPGQTYEVPATATAPLLRTGRPEGLKVTVGPTVAPAVGEPGKSVADVSLLGTDLLRAPEAAAAPPAASTPPAAPRRATTATRPRAQPRTAAPPQADPAPSNMAASDPTE